MKATQQPTLPRSGAVPVVSLCILCQDFPDEREFATFWQAIGYIDALLLHKLISGEEHNRQYQIIEAARVAGNAQPAKGRWV